MIMNDKLNLIKKYFFYLIRVSLLLFKPLKRIILFIYLLKNYLYNIIPYINYNKFF